MTNWFHERSVGNWQSTLSVDYQSPYIGYYSGGDVWGFPWEASDEAVEWVDGLNGTAYVQQALGQLSSQAPDLGTIIAELHKVPPMLASLLYRLLNIPSGLRPGSKGRKAPKHGDGSAEIEFGWHNLVRDVQDVIEIINKVGDKTRKIAASRAGDSFSRTWDISHSQSWYGYLLGTWEGEETVDVSLRGSVAAIFTPPRFRMNPITTAWELVSWSWLIDYLFSIGQWLDSLSTLTMSQGNTASIGMKVTLTKSATLSYVEENGHTGTASGSGQIQSTYVIRTPVDVPLLPQLGNVRELDFNVLRILLDIMSKVK
jgi:hypothetical protein